MALLPSMAAFRTYIQDDRRYHKCMGKLMLNISASSASTHLVDASFPNAAELVTAGLAIYVADGGAGDPGSDLPDAVQACVDLRVRCIARRTRRQYRLVRRLSVAISRPSSQTHRYVLQA